MNIFLLFFFLFLFVLFFEAYELLLVLVLQEIYFDLA